MVEIAISIIVLFTVFYGVTCVVDEVEENRRVRRGLEMLRKERLARSEAKPKIKPQSKTPVTAATAVGRGRD